MGSLGIWEESFRSVGWFIPPYIQMGVLSKIAADIRTAQGQMSSEQLQVALKTLYEPVGLAAMVLHRYPAAPVIQNYKLIIAEAIEAHFLGLDHVAVGGLTPVIEGAGRRLAGQRGLDPNMPIKDLYDALGTGIKQESAKENIGAVEEIASITDSFLDFTRHAFYAPSSVYPFSDGTNRHGIVHGAFSDSDYGSSLNFYKTIAAVDFLTFVASFRANISWMAPIPTEQSIRLSNYYVVLQILRSRKK